MCATEFTTQFTTCEYTCASILARRLLRQLLRTYHLLLLYIAGATQFTTQFTCFTSTTVAPTGFSSCIPRTGLRAQTYLPMRIR